MMTIMRIYNDDDDDDDNNDDDDGDDDDHISNDDLAHNFFQITLDATMER